MFGNQSSSLSATPSSNSLTEGPVRRWGRSIASLFKTSTPPASDEEAINPEEVTEQKREWIDSQRVPDSLATWPEHLYEHFFIVGLPPDVEVTRLAEDICEQERRHPGPGMVDESLGHAVWQEDGVAYDRPPLPAYEPQVIFQHPADKPAPLSDTEVAALCFPHGVSPSKLRRSPSLSALNEVIYGKSYARDAHSFVFLLKVGSNMPLFGVCVLSQEMVHRPPFLARDSFPSSSAPFKQCMIAAPRCYCMLTHYPFFQLHFQVLHTILGMERLHRTVEFNKELSTPTTDLNRSNGPYGGGDGLHGSTSRHSQDRSASGLHGPHGAAGTGCSGVAGGGGGSNGSNGPGGVGALLHARQQLLLQQQRQRQRYCHECAYIIADMYPRGLQVVASSVTGTEADALPHMLHARHSFESRNGGAAAIGHRRSFAGGDRAPMVETDNHHPILEPSGNGMQEVASGTGTAATVLHSAVYSFPNPGHPCGGDAEVQHGYSLQAPQNQPAALAEQLQEQAVCKVCGRLFAVGEGDDEEWALQEMGAVLENTLQHMNLQEPSPPTQQQLQQQQQQRHLQQQLQLQQQAMFGSFPLAQSNDVVQDDVNQRCQPPLHSNDAQPLHGETWPAHVLGNEQIAGEGAQPTLFPTSVRSASVVSVSNGMDTASHPSTRPGLLGRLMSAASTAAAASASAAATAAGRSKAAAAAGGGAAAAAAAALPPPPAPQSHGLGWSAAAAAVDAQRRAHGAVGSPTAPLSIIQRMMESVHMHASERTKTALGQPLTAAQRRQNLLLSPLNKHLSVLTERRNSAPHMQRLNPSPAHTPHSHSPTSSSHSPSKHSSKQPHQQVSLSPNHPHASSHIPRIRGTEHGAVAADSVSSFVQSSMHGSSNNLHQAMGSLSAGNSPTAGGRLNSSADFRQTQGGEFRSKTSGGGGPFQYLPTGGSRSARGGSVEVKPATVMAAAHAAAAAEAAGTTHDSNENSSYQGYSQGYSQVACQGHTYDSAAADEFANKELLRSYLRGGYQGYSHAGAGRSSSAMDSMRQGHVPHSSGGGGWAASTAAVDATSTAASTVANGAGGVIAAGATAAIRISSVVAHRGGVGVSNGLDLDFADSIPSPTSASRFAQLPPGSPIAATRTIPAVSTGNGSSLRGGSISSMSRYHPGRPLLVPATGLGMFGEHLVSPPHSLLSVSAVSAAFAGHVASSNGLAGSNEPSSNGASPRPPSDLPSPQRMQMGAVGSDPLGSPQSSLDAGSPRSHLTVRSSYGQVGPISPQGGSRWVSAVEALAMQYSAGELHSGGSGLASAYSARTSAPSALGRGASAFAAPAGAAGAAAGSRPLSPVSGTAALDAAYCEAAGRGRSPSSPPVMSSVSSSTPHPPATSHSPQSRVKRSSISQQQQQQSPPQPAKPPPASAVSAWANLSSDQGLQRLGSDTSFHTVDDEGGDPLGTRLHSPTEPTATHPAPTPLPTSARSLHSSTSMQARAGGHEFIKPPIVSSDEAVSAAAVAPAVACTKRAAAAAVAPTEAYVRRAMEGGDGDDGGLESAMRSGHSSPALLSVAAGSPVLCRSRNSSPRHVGKDGRVKNPFADQALAQTWSQDELLQRLELVTLTGNTAPSTPPTGSSTAQRTGSGPMGRAGHVITAAAASVLSPSSSELVTMTDPTTQCALLHGHSLQQLPPQLSYSSPLHASPVVDSSTPHISASMAATAGAVPHVLHGGSGGGNGPSLAPPGGRRVASSSSVHPGRSKIVVTGRGALLGSSPLNPGARPAGTPVSQLPPVLPDVPGVDPAADVVNPSLSAATVIDEAESGSGSEGPTAIEEEVDGITPDRTEEVDRSTFNGIAASDEAARGGKREGPAESEEAVGGGGAEGAAGSEEEAGEGAVQAAANEALQYSPMTVLNTLYRCGTMHPGEGLHLTFGGISDVRYLRPVLPRKYSIIGSARDVLAYAEVELGEALAAWAVASLARSLSLEHILTLLTAALLERQLVLFCPDISALSGCVLALIPLLRPFVWQSLLMPITPTPMLGFLEAPVPFLLGVQYKTPEVAAKCMHVIRVNVYKGQVKNAGGLPALPGLRQLSAALQPHYTALRRAGGEPRRQPSYALDEEEALAVSSFLGVLHEHLARLTGDLRPHVITNVGMEKRTAVLMKDSLLESVAVRDRPFVKAFLGTQLFSVHSDDVIRAHFERF